MVFSCLSISWFVRRPDSFLTKKFASIKTYGLQKSIVLPLSGSKAILPISQTSSFTTSANCPGLSNKINLHLTSIFFAINFAISGDIPISSPS